MLIIWKLRYMCLYVDDTCQALLARCYGAPDGADSDSHARRMMCRFVRSGMCVGEGGTVNLAHADRGVSQICDLSPFAVFIPSLALPYILGPLSPYL